MAKRAAKHESNNAETNWEDTLRAAIDESQLTRYAICKAADIQESQLARFMRGAGIKLATANAIGKVLGLAITRRDQ